MELGHLQITEDALKAMVGHTQLQIFAKLFQGLNGAQTEELKKLCKVFQAEFIRELGGKLYKGTIEKLEKLHQQNKQIFIVSNCEKGYIDLFLNQTKIDFIVDVECWGNTGKMKSENIDLVISRNYLSKQKCIYIGDTQGDFDAAKKSGIDFIYANYGFGKINAQPDFEINAIGEIELAYFHKKI